MSVILMHFFHELAYKVQFNLSWNAWLSPPVQDLRPFTRYEYLAWPGLTGSDFQAGREFIHTTPKKNRCKVLSRSRLWLPCLLQLPVFGLMVNPSADAHLSCLTLFCEDWSFERAYRKGQGQNRLTAETITEAHPLVLTCPTLIKLQH